MALPGTKSVSPLEGQGTLEGPLRESLIARLGLFTAQTGCLGLFTVLIGWVGLFTVLIGWV